MTSFQVGGEWLITAPPDSIKDGIMRVRILKPIVSAYGGFSPGAVVDVPDNIGSNWCKAGIAMQDKSLDGASETKTPSIKQKRKTRR